MLIPFRAAGPRLRGPAFLVAGFLILVPALSCLAQGVIEVEAESFVDSYNIGGRPIQVGHCEVASDGLVADGIDTPLEWIELQVTIPHTTCYADSMAFQANLDQWTTVKMTVLEFSTEEVVLTSEFFFVGSGVG